MRVEREEIQGIQSIQIGHALLQALIDARGPMTLGKLAEAAGMSTSKARGYLLSYLQLGLVEQLAEGGSYDLGPAALTLGLAALGRIDCVKLSRDALPRLHASVGETVCLSVWNQYGPVVFDKIDGPRQSAFALRIGTVPNLLTTATGRIFLAHLPSALTTDVIRRELKEDFLGIASAIDVQDIRSRVREAGMSVVNDLTLPGLSSLAAPIFDAQGEVAVVANIVGPSRSVDFSKGGTMTRALVSFTEAITRKAGGQYRRPG